MFLLGHTVRNISVQGLSLLAEYTKTITTAYEIMK